MTVVSPPSLLALDWGTTSLRAFLLAADGSVIERRAAQRGILQVKEGRFASALEEIAGDWLARHPALPALASGMIGSRQGWREVPYAEAPAGILELARGLLALECGQGRMLRLVPGVAFRAKSAPPDVMRGEETQILGALAAADRGEDRLLFVLPGTHSKWALVEGERIVSFASFMTGELFALLKAHSILGRLMTKESDDPASFRRGLKEATRGGAAAGGLLHKLFSARTLALFDELPQAGVASYLSGLLIGSELEGGLALIAAELGAVPKRVTLIAEAALAALYGTAFAARGIAVEVASGDAAALGLLAIARAAGLLG